MFEAPLRCLHELPVRTCLQEAHWSLGTKLVCTRTRNECIRQSKPSRRCARLCKSCKCGEDCAPRKCKCYRLQAAKTLMTDLRDQDDAATAVPVIRKWLRWLATPKVTSSLVGHNG